MKTQKLSKSQRLGAHKQLKYLVNEMRNMVLSLEEPSKQSDLRFMRAKVLIASTAAVLESMARSNETALTLSVQDAVRNLHRTLHTFNLGKP